MKIEIDLEDIEVDAQDDNVRVRVEVVPATSLDQINEVRISGTRSGLLFLARHVVRVAHGVAANHTHLDNECLRPVYESQGEWWLTIEYDDRTWRRLEQKVPREPRA